MCRVSAEARREGVRESSSLALAQALAPHAFIEKYNAQRDYAQLGKLAQWAIRFSPYVGLDTEAAQELPAAQHYGITLNVTGTERHHGSDKTLAEKVVAAFAERGFYARVAIAPTLGAAWALSRYWRERISFLDSFYYPLTELSVQALRIPEDTVSVLQQLGIKTIHDLLLLPRSSLGDRFGALLLQRLNQAFGKADEPFVTIVPPSVTALKKKFEIPITSQQTLSRGTLLLFEELFAALIKKNECALSFILEFESINNDRTVSVLRKELSLFSAQNSLHAIRSIIESLCEKIISPQGIGAITLRALCPEACYGTSRNLFTRELEDTLHAGEELLNHLLLRLGKERVQKIHFVSSHVPERSFGYGAVGHGAVDGARIGTAARECGPPMIRPSYLLDRPEQLQVIALLPDHPPSRMYWNREELCIVCGIGPERICDEWWRHVLDDEIREREYFRVQESSGRWLWVFRKKRTMQWFVHGVWA